MPTWKYAVITACVATAAAAVGITDFGWKWFFFCIPLDIAPIIVGER